MGYLMMKCDELTALEFLKVYTVPYAKYYISLFKKYSISHLQQQDSIILKYPQSFY